MSETTTTPAAVVAGDKPQVERRGTEAIEAIVKQLLKPFKLLHGAGLVFTILLTFVSMGGLGYWALLQHKESQETKEDIKVLKAFVVTMNQQTTLLKIVNENLRDSADAKLGSAPIDEKVATAKMLYDMATLEGVEPSLLCAIADVESSWNTHAVSAAGCEGLLQVTPAYARLCLQAKGIDYKPGIWFNPVINVMCGVKMLANNQAEHVEKGRTTKDNWVFALHSYFWGSANTNILCSKKDARVDVPNLAYSMRVIEAQNKYKEKGL